MNKQLLQLALSGLTPDQLLYSATISLDDEFYGITSIMVRDNELILFIEDERRHFLNYSEILEYISRKDFDKISGSFDWHPEFTVSGFEIDTENEDILSVTDHPVFIAAERIK